MSDNSFLIDEDFFGAAGEALIDARRGSPPAELLAQMSVAARAWEVLRAGGRTLRFRAPMDGALEIDLHGAHGELLRRLSPAEAVGLACGESAV